MMVWFKSMVFTNSSHGYLISGQEEEVVALLHASNEARTIKVFS